MLTINIEYLSGTLSIEREQKEEALKPGHFRSLRNHGVPYIQVSKIRKGYIVHKSGFLAT